MEARDFTVALSSPWITSSPVCEGDAGIHVVRSRMGSNVSPTVSDHLVPMSPACEKRTQNLANLPYSESSRRRDPVAAPNIPPSPMMTTLRVARVIATFALLGWSTKPQSRRQLDL
eukprot:3836887-Pyramimonas_sp.AAC.1